MNDANESKQLDKHNNNKDSDNKTSKRKSERSSSKHRSKGKRRSRSISSDDDDESSHHEQRVIRRKKREEERHTKKHKKHHKKQHSKRKKKRYYSSSSSSYDSSSSSSSDDSKNDNKKHQQKRVVNEKLLEKLSARGETLEEREERRGKQREKKIASKFGYTAEENPFRDPNLHEPFEWKKKNENISTAENKKSRKDKLNDVFDEIEKVRKRRQERDEEHEEFERKKADQSRLREQENYEEYEKKEEEFHLVQQRHRSAIRLVEGREKPIDVLAKNLLMFGVNMDHQGGGNNVEDAQHSVMSVKYKEKYSVWNDLKNLEAELQAPHIILQDLKLDELQALLEDIRTFLKFENEAKSSDLVLQYWNALLMVTTDEILRLKQKTTSTHDNELPTTAPVATDIEQLFKNNSLDTLINMKQEVITKLSKASSSTVNDKDVVIDTDYWQSVLNHLNVHLAKAQLSDIHSRMLVHQLETLEGRREELALLSSGTKENNNNDTTATSNIANQETDEKLPQGRTSPDFGNLDEELGLTNEVQLAEQTTIQNNTHNKKPRYFNRVKTGYDWNKYNQTHYDHDNPPPKTVQGYKFNIFYPDLLDKTKTPQYTLLPTNSPDFCIIKFQAGPPYEEVAFKIINREWNKSRKRGFRCTFERGILSLYFNFMNYHYRK